MVKFFFAEFVPDYLVPVGVLLMLVSAVYLQITFARDIRKFNQNFPEPDSKRCR